MSTDKGRKTLEDRLDEALVQEALAQEPIQELITDVTDWKKESQRLIATLSPAERAILEKRMAARRPSGA